MNRFAIFLKQGKNHTCVFVSIKTLRIKRESWLQPLCSFNFGGLFPLLGLVGPSMDWRAFTWEEKDVLHLMTLQCALALYVYIQFGKLSYQKLDSINS